jgi:hypothetical protein
MCIDSLRVFSESRVILQLFGARRLSQQSYSSFPEPPKGAYPYIRGYSSSGLVLARSAECGHRSRLRAFCNPCTAQSCPSWSESQRPLLVDSTLLGHPPQATQSAARQSAGSTKDFVGMRSSQHSSRRHLARSPAKQRRRPSYAGTSQTVRSAPLYKPIMVGCVCL